jgi:thiamine biosynthesis lipoprotein
MNYTAASGWRSLLLVILLLITGCEAETPRESSQFLAFGTMMELTLAGVDEQRAERIREQIESDFAAMHQAWHAWDPGPLARLNQAFADGERVAVPEVVKPLIIVSQTLSASSDGLFDPAIGRLVDLWGFHRDDPRGSRPPPREAVEELLRLHPKMSDLRLEGELISSANRSVKLDFGAIGKGYGIDLAIARLRRMGVEHAIVNGGGDLRAIGNRGDGAPWRIAIRHPDGEHLLGSIMVTGDESVFTSGSYERNYHWQGERYHHIIDPRTGYPAKGTASVTVIHSDATTADAAATALFIAGPAQWQRIARQMGVRMVLLMAENGDLHMNPAMRARVSLTDETAHKIHLSAPFPATATEGGA